MTVTAPGSYRHLTWWNVYDPASVARWLPVIWGDQPYGESETIPRRCRQGASRCTHRCDTDQWGEGCYLDEDGVRDCKHVHGGHRQCGKCLCVQPATIKPTDDREPDTAAITVDIKRAWRHAWLSTDIRQALFLHHVYGYNTHQLGRWQHCSPETAALRLRTGHKILADYLNGRHL